MTGSRRWLAVAGLLFLALLGCSQGAPPAPTFGLGRPQMGGDLARGDDAALAVGISVDPPVGDVFTRLVLTFQAYDPQTQTLIPNGRYRRDNAFIATADRCVLAQVCPAPHAYQLVYVPAGDYVLKSIIALDDSTRPPTGKGISLVASVEDDSPFRRTRRRTPNIGHFEGGLRYHVAAGEVVDIGEFVIDLKSSPAALKEIVRNDARTARIISLLHPPPGTLVFRPPGNETGRPIQVRDEQAGR